MTLFIPENALEEALVKAAKQPALAQNFHRLLLTSDVMVIGTVDASQAAAGGTFTAGPGSQFQLETGEKNGTRFLPVFTALPRMQVYAGRECKYLAMTGAAMFELTRGAPVTLNPGSEYAQDFPAALIGHLLGGGSPRLLESSDTEIPAQLAAALCELFDRRGDVQTAWMIHFGPRGGPTRPLVGIEAMTDIRAMMPDIEATVRQAAPGLVVDIQRVNRNRPTAMADVLMQSLPFYTRALPGRILN